jgi:hypothetical protein
MKIKKRERENKRCFVIRTSPTVTYACCHGGCFASVLNNNDSKESSTNMPQHPNMLNDSK